jgi:type II secretory pathway pseudopilin PulG
MKNNRGFTLIELLSVLIILIALALLIVPTIGKYLNEGKQDAFNSQVKMILTSVQTWFTETDVNGTEVVTNIQYLPSNSKGTNDLSTSTGTSLSADNKNYRVIKLSIPLLQNIGAISYNIKNPNTNVAFTSDYYVEVDYCGDNSWSYKMIYKGNAIDKTSDCSQYGILTLAVQKYLDANKSSLSTSSNNSVLISTLDLDSDTSYTGSVIIKKTGTTWSYTYGSVTTALE